MPPFQLLFRLRQNEVFVANLPLFASSGLVRQIFANFGKVSNVLVKELAKAEKPGFVFNGPRAARVATLALDVQGALALSQFDNKEQFIILGNLDQSCLLQVYNQQFQQSQAPADFVHLFLKMLDQQEKPTKLDGWTLNLNVKSYESKRQKKQKLNDFKLHFYKEVEGIRKTSNEKEKFFLAEKAEGKYDSV